MVTSHWAPILENLAPRRALYQSCLQGIAAQVADDFAPLGARVLELGAGLGQLGSWLGAERITSWTLTEPEEELVARLRTLFPKSHAVASRAEELPVASDAFHAVAGLCALDVVSDLSVVAREIYRVLRPGGHFFHLLDMTTTLPRLVADIAAGAMVAIPNLFFDPAQSTWPEDLVLLENGPLKHLLRELRSIKHPLPEVFGDYFGLYRQVPFNPTLTGRALRELTNEPESRSKLAQACASADQLALQHGWPRIAGTPVSTARHLERRLMEAFSSTGFEVLVSDLAQTWERVPPSPSTPAYRSLCVGHERVVEVGAPERMLCADAPSPTRETPVIETGVFVFVARKPR